MSTRSFIAHRITDGYQGVYCHWDGYLEHNGVILQENYADPEKVARLISHGDISSLAKIVGRKHRFGNQGKSTTFYGRDRGEQNCGPVLVPNIDALLAHAETCGTEYVYVFENDRWVYAERGMQFFGLSDGTAFSKFQPLAPALVKLTDDGR